MLANACSIELGTDLHLLESMVNGSGKPFGTCLRAESVTR